VNFTIRAGARSETGTYRENNEDRHYVDPDGRVYIVADGMGGQHGGEQASQLAVDHLARKLKAVDNDQPGDKAAVDAICKAVLDVNHEITVVAKADAQCRNMGTTAVMAVRCGDRLFIAGIGDSRAYHLRAGRIEQLTVDHSIAQALVDAETISPEEARGHRFRNVLWKYLGAKELGRGPDVRVVPLMAGDRFLLASDGLTGVVDDDDLLKIISEHNDPQSAADALVKAALDKDTHDNTTCVVLYVDEAK
jgi:protein phosphatase